MPRVIEEINLLEKEEKSEIVLYLSTNEIMKITITLEIGDARV